VTVNITDSEILLTALDGSTPKELVISYFNFIRQNFPDSDGGIYEYCATTDDLSLIGGNDVHTNDKDDEQGISQFVYPELSSNCGFLIRLKTKDVTTSENIAVYCNFFGLLFQILLHQIASCEERNAEHWAGIVSQLTHDLSTLIDPEEKTPGDRNKIQQKKKSLEKAFPRLLLYIRPLQISQSTISFRQIFDAIIEKYPDKNKITTVDLKNLDDINIICDAELMDMAISELLDNAILASRIQGGPVHISGKLQLRGSSVQSREWLQIEVTNPVSSIPKEFLQQVKNPMFTTWKNEGRSGMGLALVDRIIKAHNGIFDIKSAPALGVKQTIYLPFFKADEET